MLRPAFTTAILVETLVDEEAFSRRGQIVRYAIPPRYSRAPNWYARLHTELREKLPYPYYFYTYDRPEPAIYVLYPPNSPILPVSLALLNEQELKHTAVPVGEISQFHILVKLLQAAYFQSRRKEVATQGKYYIVAKRTRDKRFLTCLRIDITAAPGAEGETTVQEFKIVDSATLFRRWDEPIENFPKNSSCFGSLSPKGGQAFLRPLKMSELDTWNGDIYLHSSKKQGRTTLPFHSVLKVRESRGYLLHEFIRNFLRHLEGYGVRASSKQRQFTEFHPSSKDGGLPVDRLHTVWLLDNRLNRDDIPFEHYQKSLSDSLGEELGLEFRIVTPDQITEDKALLVLQDAHRQAFEEGGQLEGRADPYQQLYRNPTWRRVPKQSITINPNDPDNEEDDYLTYDLIPLTDLSWCRRFRVAIGELYLKTLILWPTSITGHLPLVDGKSATLMAPRTPISQYVFVRTKTVDKVSYRTLLYFEEDQLKFSDLRDPEQRQQILTPLLKRLGLDWQSDVAEPLREKYHKEEVYLKRYDLILGPNQVIEIEDTKEDILYDYKEIGRRVDELEEPFPIADLYLAPHYDLFKPNNYPPLAELQGSQLTLWEDGPIQYGEGRAYLDRLERFDALLREVARHRSTLSFEELTQGPLGEKVADLFELRRPDGKIHRGKLQSLYQKRGMFLSRKSREVHLYQGIWYDDELCYMVGDRQSLKSEQPVAHLLRRFDVYRGIEYFDVHQWLDTVTVHFVRPERYTVFPYFFHLLELYVASYLSLKGELDEDDPVGED